MRVADSLVRALVNLRSARRWVALGQLYELFRECGQAGWDGGEAEPVNVEVFATARDFLKTLPVAFPSPEVAPGEEGTISLDWFPTPDSNFSVLVYPGAKLVFATVAPRRRIRGVEIFGDEVPETVISELRRLF